MDDEGLTIQEPSGGRAAVGKQLTSDRYRVGPAIAKGGMGEVFDAEDAQIGRPVAIKRMLRKDPSDRAISRFIREAQIQGRLDHPSIVPVHEIGRDHDGRPFFAMKKLTGTTLAAILDGNLPFAQQRLLRAFVDVCLAVELAHTRGVVHRDLKPSNIMLGDFGEVYVLDWGVAKVVGVPDDDTGDTSDDNLTLAGATIGTPGFMPAEQIRDASAVDARADVYALGCVLFEILARSPLHPRGRAGVNSALAGADARPSTRAPDRTIPPELDALCVEATAALEQRTLTARALGERVQQYLDGDRDLERRADIAREHLATARAALAKPDDETSRAVAMREAGRALALDPRSTAAAEIISRLMLEPPRSLPKDVERQLAEDSLEAERRHARISRLIVISYLVFIPFLALSFPWYYATSFGVVLALQLAMLRRESRSPIFRGPLAILRNALLIVILARAWGLLIAPGVAGLTASALLLSSAFERMRSVLLLCVAFALAMLVPYAAELAGLVSPTMHFMDNGIAFLSDQAQAPIGVRELGLAIYVTALVAAGAAIAWPMLSSERGLRRQLYVQTWQLRQLVT